MEKLTAITIGIASSITGAPLVAFLKHRFSKRASKDEYRRNRIDEWKMMVNQVHDIYPVGHFKNWDQYPSLEKFLSRDQRQQVSNLKLGDSLAVRISSRQLGSQDMEFMNVVRMLKAEIARVEHEIWKLI